MSKLITLTTIFFLVFNSFGQEVIATDGNYSSIASGSLSWTLGEVVVETTETASGVLTQGFQQDYENILTLAENGWLSFTTYPNPFQREVTIESNYNGVYSLSILDNQSKIVFMKEIEHSNSVTIDLSFLNSGIYYIEILRNDTMKKFFKTIVKLN